ncbi:tRNA lysidine(34) synthetase TilS [Ornithinimicrobium cerasi]|uniref:tRNA(Ile)-lysidine synthase n=1 Tax=Ornithinimicrobium cerasi TaxID=2248773 RepID=A0A285VSV8_9MICO|nr:tRNA lysidine(34) synthetase TilS [Ornithinimicrobium cerasi]SOC56316.1 tRNA(Ile)-lysidine synthase [Ornithinimicrobium cerasi]
MPGPPAAVAQVRHAVRQALVAADLAADRTWLTGTPPDAGAPLVLVACSGGADSLALAAGTAFVAPRLGLRAGAVVVDHGLQGGSAQVAAEAAGRCRDLGLDPVEVVPVTVAPSVGGVEGAARKARYAALAARASALGAVAVLVGHTLDDQAEQVLLGLARGSGARSLAGMPARRGLGVEGGEGGEGGAMLLRPLLGTPRARTSQACADLALLAWEDPHNHDPRFTRVRVRRALADLEADLGPGLAAALVRSADLLRDDAEALEAVSATAYRQLGDPPWQVPELGRLPRAVRTRLWRRLALAAGSPGTDLTAQHLLAVDDLVTGWRGQGEVHLPGGVRAGRREGRVWLGRADPSTMAGDPAAGPDPTSRH